VSPEKYLNRVELLQGTLDLLIMESLRRSPAHGYAITHLIRARSADALQVATGSLYPALHRLERQGLLDSEWGITDQKQRAKFYRLTADGIRQLDRDRSKWTAIVEAITGILGP
jgi:PadR family transcriptional regulator PadR